MRPRRLARARVRGFLVVVVLVLLAAPRFAASDPLDAARALYGDGKYAEAAAAFRDAAIELESTDPVTAGAAFNNACVLSLNTGDAQQAEEDCRHALRLRSGGEPSEPLAKTHNNLGLVLKRLARYREAIGEFESAIAINRTLENPAGQAVNLSNLGATAIESGDFARAIESFEAIAELGRQHADQSWAARQMHLSRINLAVVYERLGAYREALTLYDEALATSESLSEHERATLSINRGVAYRNLGDPVQAERAFHDAAATYRELEDRPSLINVYLNLAVVNHLNLRRPEQAERFYRDALALAREIGETTQETQCLDYLGRFLLEFDRIDEAEASFSAALALARESESSEATAESLEGLGRCAQARGEFETALDHAVRGIDEIENVRGTLEAEDLRASYRATKRPVYSLAVESLARLDEGAPEPQRATRALEIVHRAKARELVDRLALGAAPDLSSTPDLPRGNLLVEYFVGENDLFRWSVDESSVAMQNLGPATPVLESVIEVHRQLSAGNRPDVSRLESLAATLLGGLEPVLARAGALTVSADRALHNLPFELLPYGPEKAPLVGRYAMNYLPSGALRSIERTSHGKTARISLGIGSPDTRAPGSEFLTRRYDLGPLASAEDELRQLEGWIGSPVEIHTGVEATEEAFVRRYTEGTRILHVATHTVLDEAAGSSAILFSPGDGSDGLLHPHEIARLAGASELTVLAACRTAAGQDAAGSARNTLTGAFLLSGSSAVLATLWDIDDAVTQAFMEQFYFELGTGVRPSEALARAKRTFLADPEWDDPSLWAAYVLVGDSVPLARSFPAKKFVWILFLAAAVLVAVGLYGRTVKRAR